MRVVPLLILGIACNGQATPAHPELDFFCYGCPDTVDPTLVQQTFHPGEPLVLARPPLLEPWSLEVHLDQVQQGTQIRFRLTTCLAGEEDGTCDAVYDPSPNGLQLLDGPLEVGETLLVTYTDRTLLPAL